MNKSETQKQTTLRAPAYLEGRGIHTGAPCRIAVLPAPADYGLRFLRTDLPGRPEIPARAESVGIEPMMRQTVLTAPDNPEARVMTVEHLLAALSALEIDNARIEMSAPEAPIWDGSGAQAAECLVRAGKVELEGSLRDCLRPEKPIVFLPPEADGVEYTLWPSAGLTVTYFLEYDHPAIGSQAASFAVSPELFAREIAPARTFCTIEEVEFLRSKGLIQGGSIDNAVVFGPDGPMNTELRWDNEPARHKALDLLGDLALLGAPLRGHVLVARGGHQTNAQFVKHVRKELGIT